MADELAPQRGAVPVMPLERLVDFGFAIAPVAHEIAHQPTQDYGALLAARRNRFERAVFGDEALQHLRLERLRLLRFADGLENAARQALERVPVERVPARGAFGSRGDETLRLQDREMMRDGRLLEIERTRQLLHAPFARGQKTDDAEPAFVGHRLEEIEQRLGHGSVPFTSI